MLIQARHLITSLPFPVPMKSIYVQKVRRLAHNNCSTKPEIETPLLFPSKLQLCFFVFSCTLLMLLNQLRASHCAPCKVALLGGCNVDGTRLSRLTLGTGGQHLYH
jgi:hypothetical protein